jgi:tRNA dimethylallyltransferase
MSELTRNVDGSEGHGAAPAWIVLTGPTACGKSRVAMALAQRWPIEIISVDSALVYRGMDIGTAKPSPADQLAVVHHLIDTLEPTQVFSAAAFVREATRLVQAITARGRVPLLVGGTMLYLRAWLHGIDDLPQADASVRAALEIRARSVGWPAMHAELARVDAITAARLAPHDGQRIQRALEVWKVTGQPMSSLLRGPQAVPQAWMQRVISLEPVSRPWLHARIAARFHAMLDEGLVDEVRGLRARGDLHASLPSMRCVGYRQAWEALDTQTLDELPQRGIAATRQLAKRQHTWLRAMKGRVVVPCDADASANTPVEADARTTQQVMRTVEALMAPD